MRMQIDKPTREIWTFDTAMNCKNSCKSRLTHQCLVVDGLLAFGGLHIPRVHDLLGRGGRLAMEGGGAEKRGRGEGKDDERGVKR